MEEGVEFRNPAKAPGGFLPLEAYDNKDLESKNPFLSMNKKSVKLVKIENNNVTKDGADQDNKAENAAAEESAPKKTEIPGQGLWKDKDGLCFWRRLRVQKYLPKTDRYEGYWENTKEKCRLHRIYILFDHEDPREFCKRFKHAYQTRVMAESLLKYNFYVENMPTH
jgi:hypothetical protein